MKKAIVIGMTMVALLSANQARSDVCEIVNRSFEDDGYIPDITVKEPNGWDVNIPPNKFKGHVSSEWATKDSYCLTLYVEYLRTYEVNDTATVSQELYLADVNEIIFDLKLDTWNPDICTAILLIGNDIVWDSESAGILIPGEYLNQKYIVEDNFRDGESHKLSLGIRVNVSGTLWKRYVSHWDDIKCTGFCGEGGLLAGDFNRDCYVDINDLKMMADVWLNELASDDRFNLFGGDDITESDGGIISFRDFVVFANSWDGDIADLQGLAEKWLQQVGIDDQYNLYKGDDSPPGGIINFFDFAVFADNWLESSYE